MSATGPGPAPTRAPEPLPEGLRAGRVVLDASYVIALLDGEEAAQAFAPLLSRAVLTAPAAGEVFSKLHTASAVEPGEVEGGLVALGVELVDLPVAAAHHFPALRAVDAARRAQQRENGERPVRTLSLGDLCVLGHALHTQLPVLTGDRHWATLALHGLAVEVHLFRPEPDTQGS